VSPKEGKAVRKRNQRWRWCPPLFPSLQRHFPVGQRLQLSSGAPNTHHSQLHFHTVRTVPQEVYRDASVCSLLQPQVVAQCFDGHLRSQKKAAGGKDRDIRTCSKCTPVTAHPDWMQSAVAIVAEYVCTVRMYVQYVCMY